jgi:hypothetical protein
VLGLAVSIGAMLMVLGQSGSISWTNNDRLRDIGLALILAALANVGLFLVLIAVGAIYLETRRALEHLFCPEAIVVTGLLTILSRLTRAH